MRKKIWEQILWPSKNSGPPLKNGLPLWPPQKLWVPPHKQTAPPGKKNDTSLNMLTEAGSKALPEHDVCAVAPAVVYPVAQLEQSLAVAMLELHDDE